MSAQRRNAQRREFERKRIGSKDDGQLCSDPPADFLVIEAAKAQKYPFYGTKFDHDFDKLVRNKHDMLRGMHVDYGSELAKKSSYRHWVSSNRVDHGRSSVSKLVVIYRFCIVIFNALYHPAEMTLRNLSTYSNT